MYDRRNEFKSIISHVAKSENNYSIKSNNVNMWYDALECNELLTTW